MNQSSSDSDEIGHFKNDQFDKLNMREFFQFIKSSINEHQQFDIQIILKDKILKMLRHCLPHKILKYIEQGLTQSKGIKSDQCETDANRIKFSTGLSFYMDSIFDITLNEFEDTQSISLNAQLVIKTKEECSMIDSFLGENQKFFDYFQNLIEIKSQQIKIGLLLQKTGMLITYFKLPLLFKIKQIPDFLLKFNEIRLTIKFDKEVFKDETIKKQEEMGKYIIKGSVQKEKQKLLQFMSAKMKMECPYFTLISDLHSLQYPQLFGCQISNGENLNNILRLFGQNIQVPEILGFKSMKVFFDLKEKLLFVKTYFDYKDQSQQANQCKIKKVTFLLAQQGCQQTDFKIKIAAEVFQIPFSLIIYKNELTLPDIKNIFLSLGVKSIDRMSEGIQGIKIKQNIEKKLMTTNPVSKKLVEKALVQVQLYENKVKTSIKAQIKCFKEQLEQSQQERYLINKGEMTISQEDMTNLITSFYYKNQDVANNNENLQQAINDNQNWKALVTCTKLAAFLKQHLKDYEIKTKKPITLKEVLKMIPLLDQIDIIPQEILENVTIKQFIFSLKDSQCQQACLKLLIHKKWVIIKDSIELTDIEFMIDYQKDSGIQAAMMQCKFKDFEILGSYKKDKDWHFMGKTKPGKKNFNPFRVLGYYTNLPAWLQKITTMDEVYIFFNKQGEIQITLESNLDLDIFQFGDLKIFRLQNYRFELCKNSMEVSLKIQGNLTLLGMDIAFDAQYLSNKEKDIVILGTVAKDFHIVELLQKLEQNDQEDEIAHSSLIIRQGSFVLIDSKLKKFEIKSKMGLGNINLVIFKNDSSGKRGFHLSYDFLEDNYFELFNDWGLEKVQVSYCSLTCLRVNMIKSPLTIEVDIDLSKNEFTKKVKECLEDLTRQNLKILRGIYQYNGKKMINLPTDFKCQLKHFDIFCLKFENFNILPDGFQCHISLTIDTKIKKIDQSFDAIYKKGKLTFEYSLQTFKLKLLPGLELQNLSLEGKIFPHPQQISVRCDCYLLNNEQPSEFSFDPKRQRFRVAIAQGQMLALSVFWEILTGEKVIQKLEKIIDFVKIMPLTENDSIVLAFNGKTDFEFKCKISIHQTIIIMLDLRFSIFSGFNVYLELNPIHIFDSLQITSVKDQTKGPQFSLQMLPFQKKFNLSVSGLFKYQDLQFNSHIKLEPDIGLMFTVSNTLNIYSMVKTCSTFDVLINQNGFSFDADFLFLLNIKKSEETEFEVFGHKYTIPKFEVIGAEFNTRIKLLNKQFYIKGSLSLSLLGVELQLKDLEFSTYECSFKQLSIEMVQEVLKQFSTLITKIAQEKLTQLGQAIKEYLKKGWNQIISISKSAVSFFQDFFKQILEKKCEAIEHGLTEEQIETISSSMAKKVGRQFSKQLIKEKHYDDAFAVLASEDDSILSSDGHIDQEALYQKAQQLKSSRKKVVFWNKIKEYSSNTQDNTRVEESITQIQNAEEQLAKEQNEGEEESDSGDEDLELDLKQYTLDGCNYSEEVANEEISKNEEENKVPQKEEEKSKKAEGESFFERWLKGDSLLEILDQKELEDEQKNQQKDISNQQEIKRTQAKSTPIIIDKIEDYESEEEKQMENLETNCEIDIDSEEEMKKALAMSMEESNEIKDRGINKFNNKPNAQKQIKKNDFNDENEKEEEEAEQKLLKKLLAMSMGKDKEIEDINNKNNKQNDEEYSDDELQKALSLSLAPIENDILLSLQKQIDDDQTPGKQSTKSAQIDNNHQIGHYLSDMKSSVKSSSKDIEELKEAESLSKNGEGNSQSLEEEKEYQGLKEAQYELSTQDLNESEYTRPIPQINQEQINYLQEQVKGIQEKIIQKDFSNLKETDMNSENANLAGSSLNKEGSSIHQNSKLTIQQLIQKIEELQNSIKILESKFTEATGQQNSATQKEEQKYSLNELESLQNFDKAEDILAELSDEKLYQMDIEELNQEINKCKEFNEALLQTNKDREQQNQYYQSERNNNESNGKCNCGKPMRPQKNGNITEMKETCICGKDGKKVKKFGSNIHGFED